MITMRDTYIYVDTINEWFALVVHHISVALHMFQWATFCVDIALRTQNVPRRQEPEQRKKKVKSTLCFFVIFPSLFMFKADANIDISI